MNRPSWSLADLLAAAGFAPDAPVPAVAVTQVTDDSRKVRPGALFVAVRGSQADGHRHLREAVDRGARAVLVEEEAALPQGVIQLAVPSTRRWLGPLAHAFLGSPSRQLRMVGVTGTKGKTTVTWLIQHLLEQSGIACGLLGTVFHRWGKQTLPSDNTTPGASELQEYLREMRDAGMEACALEVSSHALDQHRTEGIRWACAVFTNLHPEHLDYHGTWEGYLQAKRRLFESLPAEGTAILNLSDPSFPKIREAVQGRVVTYGLTDGADWTAEVRQTSLEGISFVLRAPQGRWGPIRSRLIGLHNLENLLAALAAAEILGLSADRAAGHVASFAGVPGRLERVECGQPFPIFVDYAHTEGALRRVLGELRAVTDRKILTVFGCGGDRDRAKRPAIGRAAAGLSDRVIVTSDNPRSEDPTEIARQIVAGMEGGLGRFQLILDRREAIRAALEWAGEDWLVLIAGKGHESRQIFSDRVVPFDDRQVVQELLGVSGARCAVSS